MEKQRKHFMAADKVKLLCRQMVEKVPVSRFTGRLVDCGT